MLAEIGADEAPRLRRLQQARSARRGGAGAAAASAQRDAIGVSAATGEGIPELLDAIETAFEQTLRPMDLLFPYDEGAALSELHAIAGRLEREDSPEGVHVQARVPIAVAHRFAPYAASAARGSGGERAPTATHADNGAGPAS